MKVAIIVFLLSAGFYSATQAALPMAVDGQPLPTLAPMLERVQQSVVSISTQSQYQVRRRNDPFIDDPFFRRFFSQRRSSQPQTRQAIATGVIIDAFEGLVLTNEHSVVGSDSITVTLSDGREAEGIIIGSDKASDVAIIKIDLRNLSAISLGDSDTLRVGDFVVSVGDPLGLQNTVTSGIVSALGRPGITQSYQSFIQSDAGYGPGILINLRGELVGLNISKVAQTAGNTRIGFSTPVNMAVKVKDQLVKYGTPQRGFLSVQIQDLTPDLAAAFNLEQSRGAVVTNVVQGSTAEDAGLQVGDVVMEANQTVIDRGNDLRGVIGQAFAGEALDMTILRRGQPVLVSAVLESSTAISSKGTMIHPRLQGATFNEVDTQKVSTAVEQGVLVTQVTQGSVAWNHGVRPNDIIVSANRRAVSNLESFRKAIANQDVLMLNIVRGGGALFLLLQ